MPIGLAENRHAKAFALQQPAQQSHGEARMIDVRVAGDKHHVDRIPTARGHFGRASSAAAAVLGEAVTGDRRSGQPRHARGRCSAPRRSANGSAPWQQATRQTLHTHGGERIPGRFFRKQTAAAASWRHAISRHCSRIATGFAGEPAPVRRVLFYAARRPADRGDAERIISMSKTPREYAQPMSTAVQSSHPPEVRRESLQIAGQRRLSLERIQAVRRELGSRLLILGHHYQQDEVIALADLRGDSYQLSQMAAGNTDCRAIAFCGVHFMAETADILANRPERLAAALRRASDRGPARPGRRLFDGRYGGDRAGRSGMARDVGSDRHRRT